jgi:hypothetical protein
MPLKFRFSSLNKIYSQQNFANEYPASVARNTATSASTSMKTAPTKFAQTLLSLEMQTTHWLERMMDSIHKSLSREKLSKEEFRHRMSALSDTLGVFDKSF